MKPSNLPIKTWSEDDRPREKLMSKGKDALSNAELIAILIGSGNRSESAVELSKRILASVDNNLNVLGKLSLEKLMQFKGIGQAKAISIVAALEIGRRRGSEKIVDTAKITSSKIVFEIMRPIIGELPHEEFWVLFLNNANKIISKSQISRGGITTTTADVRLIFKKSLEIGATAIILCHNHPSRNLEASQADITITQKITQAGKSLDIKVLDHIIIAENDYLSFLDKGIFPKN